MTVQMLPGNGTTETIPLDRLVSLEDAGFDQWAWCIRDIDEEYMSLLVESDDSGWPPLETVLVRINGQVCYAVIDGNHRWQAATHKKLATLKVIARTYQNENAVIEAAFQANLRHGLHASTSTRSDYAVWLYNNDPSDKPNLSEIARKVGVNKSTVSRAIKAWEASGNEDEESQGYREEASNAKKLVTALHRFFEQEHTLLGSFTDGTGQRDVTARAKALCVYIGSQPQDKIPQIVKELRSINETLGLLDEMIKAGTTKKKDLVKK